jgi:hypothetical protein
MKKILAKFSEPKKPVKSVNIERAQARKIQEEGWIFLEERPALIGKIVRACRTKTMVAVKINKSKKEHSTIIVDVDRSSGHYKLDQMEESAHEQIEDGTVLKMYGMVDGVKSFWDGVVMGVEKGEELVSKSGKTHQSWVYVVSRPFEMSYVQRRTAFRLVPGMHTSIRTQFESYGEFIDVEIRDISNEGIGLWLFREPINYGIGVKVTTPAVLVWDELLRAEFDFTCLWINQTKEGAGWRVGGTFSFTDPAHEKELEKLIRMVEMEQLRSKDKRV